MILNNKNEYIDKNLSNDEVNNALSKISLTQIYFLELIIMIIPMMLFIVKFIKPQISFIISIVWSILAFIIYRPAISKIKNSGQDKKVVDWIVGLILVILTILYVYFRYGFSVIYTESIYYIWKNMGEFKTQLYLMFVSALMFLSTVF